MGCLSLVVLLGAGIAFALVVSERLGNNVARVHDAFGALDESTRPPPTGALTFLLFGTDSRSETTPAGVTVNGTNSEGDVVMIAQVAPDRRSATVVSIPRDTWVDIPDRRANRIATAYSAGGPSLLIRTVEGAGIGFPDARLAVQDACTTADRLGLHTLEQRDRLRDRQLALAPGPGPT